MTQVSLDRYKRGVRQVHEALSQHPDGLTAWEIHKATGIERGMLHPILDDNLLFYVDRWQLAKTNKLPCKVWMAVPINNPGDCPKPDDL